MRILTIFLTLVHRINLILRILIQLNGEQDLTMVSLMLNHSKCTKMPFGMVQITKNGFF